jgi:hypothetical protein
MNRHFAIALVIATAAAGNAFADDITIDPTPFTSSMSRAEVQADLQQFRQSGVNPWSKSYDPLAGFRSERSLAEVRAEYIAARDVVAAQGSEHGGAMVLAHGPVPAPLARIAAR